jgi:hypothetical protein
LSLLKVKDYVISFYSILDFADEKIKIKIEIQGLSIGVVWIIKTEAQGSRHRIQNQVYEIELD